MKPELIVMTEEEIQDIKTDRDRKRGRKIKGYFTTKGEKRFKRSRYSMRNGSQGYAKMNWEQMELGRR